MSALTRREFIALSSAAACWPAFGGLLPSTGKKLLPDYWCTWTYQNELAAERNTEKSSLAGDQGAFAARNFAENESWCWDVRNRAVMQCAPAVVARGLALPKVRPLGEGRVGVSVQDLAYGRTVRAEVNAADGVLRLDVAALKAAVAEGGKPVPAIALTLSA